MSASINVVERFLLSKCWACSIKNCEPCSHWRSRSCSRLCGVFPWAVGWPVPPSIELNDGPCGWLAALLRAYDRKQRENLSEIISKMVVNHHSLHWPTACQGKLVRSFVSSNPYSMTYTHCAPPFPWTIDRTSSVLHCSMGSIGCQACVWRAYLSMERVWHLSFHRWCLYDFVCVVQQFPNLASWAANFWSQCAV